MHFTVGSGTYGGWLFGGILSMTLVHTMGLIPESEDQERYVDAKRNARQWKERKKEWEEEVVYSEKDDRVVGGNRTFLICCIMIPISN